MQSRLTQRIAKARIADALTASKRRNQWTNTDLADLIGRSEATVRNRLNDDSPDEQMQVYELLRLCEAVSDDERVQVLAAIGLVRGVVA